MIAVEDVVDADDLDAVAEDAFVVVFSIKVLTITFSKIKIGITFIKIPTIPSLRIIQNKIRTVNTDSGAGHTEFAAT